MNAGEISATEVVAKTMTFIERRNPAVNAFTEVLQERARLRAESLDQRERGSKPLDLAGVPFAVKNLFDISGITTVAGSKINRANPPATQDALVIQRLEARGAILVGALNMGEYAYDFSGENVHDGPCRNPWALDRMAGGSSSGSGAAAAAGMVPLTLGTDTNGSIRVPSSLCGVFGLKPTFGRIPRTGVFPFSDSLDHVGPIARGLDDLALAYNGIQGYSATDHVCVDRPVENIEVSAGSDDRPVRVGLLGDFFDVEEMQAAKRALEIVASALGNSASSVTGCSLPLAEAARSAAFLITNVEGASFHRDRLLEDADAFDPDTRDRFIAGSLLPAAWYIQAQRVRALFAQQAASLFKDFDVLIAPATPTSAPNIGQRTMQLAGAEVNVRANLGIFTQPLSCIGLPVLSAPVNVESGLPIGIQVIAAPWREDLCFHVTRTLMRLGAVVERALPLDNP